MAKITWLHISDTHILRPTDTEGAEAYNQEKVLDRFIDFMENGFPNGRIERPQYLFITGDLAFTGQKEDYEGTERPYCVKTMIERIAGVMGIQESEYPERIFPVPGNHDIDRKIVTDKRFQKFVLEIAENPDDLTDLFVQGEKKDRRDKILKRSKDYCDFVKELWGEDDSKDVKDILWYAKHLSVGSKKLHVVGLNSAWLCHSHWCLHMQNEPKTKAEPTEHLTMCEAMVNACFKKVSSEKVSEDDLVLAMMHHDYARTSDSDTDVKHLLERDCDFILCGHEHNETWAQPTLRRAHKVRAGNFYLQRDRRNAVNIVEVDLDESQVKMLTVHYRTDKGGFWVVDRDYDPTEGAPSHTYNFDQYTGLLRFAIRGKKLIWPQKPPPATVRNWKSEAGKLLQRLASHETKERFDGCSNQIVVAEMLRPLHQNAKRAKKHLLKETSDAIILRNDAIISLCNHVTDTMKLAEEDSRDSWCTDIDKTANADISYISKPLMEALVVILTHRESEEFKKPEVPIEVSNALSTIQDNSDRIMDKLVVVHQEGMKKAHKEVSDKAKNIGKCPGTTRIKSTSHPNRRKRSSQDTTQAREGS